MIDCRPSSNYDIVHFTKPAGVLHLPVEALAKMEEDDVMKECGIDSKDSEGNFILPSVHFLPSWCEVQSCHWDYEQIRFSQ